MKNTNIYISILLTLFLTSCVSRTTSMTTKLQINMSKEEVIKIMGKPEEKRILNKNDIFVYYLHDSILSLIIGSTFPYVGFYPINRTGKEYWVIFNGNNQLYTAFMQKDYISIKKKV